MLETHVVVAQPPLGSNVCKAKILAYGDGPRVMQSASCENVQVDHANVDTRLGWLAVRENVHESTAAAAFKGWRETVG